MIVDSYQAAWLFEMRLPFAMPRKVVTKPKCAHHAAMAEHWCEMARRCGRPEYHEARGFSTDRWGKSGMASICGSEVPYGPFSRSHWKYIRLAMREAFLSGWHEAIGTTYETVEGGRSHAILTGLTA